MGADAIGFILVGPHKLAKKNVEAARKYLLKMRAKAQKLLDAGAEVDVEKELGVDLGSMGCDDVDEQLRYLIGADDAFLKEFVSWWNSDGWRDTAVRFWKGYKIVAAVEMSWGDGFSEGSSGKLCELAVNVGLTDVLGIH